MIIQVIRIKGVFKIVIEKRKENRGHWYYGHQLPERRKVG